MYHRWALQRDFGIAQRTGARRPAPLDPGLAPGLNLIGYFESPTGVGESARALARAAESAGIPIARIEASALEDGPPAVAPFAVNLFHVNAEAAAAAVELCGPRVHRGRANVAYWYWETETFPARWRDRFAYFDELWVASEFCRRALDAVSPIPVAVVAPPVGAAGGSAGSSPSRGGDGGGAFRFLTICDAESVVERKNPLGAVRAFRRAFELRPSVSLTVKVSNAASAPDLVAALGEARGAASVTVETGRAGRDDVERLLAGCDAYVSLHRAEGFGLPIAEAMSLGKPVVATDYSGSRDFLDAETGFPVRWRPVTTDRPFGPYEAGTRWAEPDEPHAAECLRRVVAEPAEAARRARAGERRVRDLYGLEPAARRLAARLGVLRARLAARP